jgi:D-glycero-D-manno-heptose 1,7-bisphosphate phosphatase
MFDRDGTLIEKIHHLSRIEEVKLVPFLGQTLKKISQLGYKLGVVTNQSIISRGLASQETVIKINDFIFKEVLKSHRVKFDFTAICPHLPEHGCDCRKPQIGLIRNLIESEQIDVTRSFMVGDQASDVGFGRNAGLQTVYIGTSSYNGEDGGGPNHIINELRQLPQILIDFENNYKL